MCISVCAGFTSHVNFLYVFVNSSACVWNACVILCVSAVVVVFDCIVAFWFCWLVVCVQF